MVTGELTNPIKRLPDMLRSLLLLILLTINTACSEPVKYTFGFSGDEDNRYGFVTAKFDNRMYVPVGNVGCCLGDAGATSSMFPKAYPKEGYFEWIDEKTFTYYSATIKYPENLKQIADDLPDFYLVTNYENITRKEPKRVYLITSVTSDNQVISWISNSGSRGSHIKKELIEIGRAKGKVPLYQLTFVTSDASERFWLQRVVMDNQKQSALRKNSVDCCYAEGRPAPYFPKQFPRSAYIEWHDMPKDTYYKATLNFPENLEEQAQELLAKTKQDSATEKPPQVYLLTSITANNEVIMWLSNAASKKQNPDRTLIELDRKKGEVYISGWERDWKKEINSES
jgi:hypothetical protein